MYKSPVLKKAVKILYTTEPWRGAILQPWFDCSERFDESPETIIPLPVVAFAACAFRCVLDSLTFDTEESLPFSTVPYGQVYEDLLYMIQNDASHCLQGEEVSKNIQALISDIDA